MRHSRSLTRVNKDQRTFTKKTKRKKKVTYVQCKQYMKKDLDYSVSVPKGNDYKTVRRNRYKHLFITTLKKRILRR